MLFCKHASLLAVIAVIVEGIALHLSVPSCAHCRCVSLSLSLSLSAVPMSPLNLLCLHVCVCVSILRTGALALEKNQCLYEFVVLRASAS